eukprot:1442637-Amphidinium_carterae.1
MGFFFYLFENLCCVLERYWYDGFSSLSNTNGQNHSEEEAEEEEDHDDEKDLDTHLFPNVALNCGQSNQG